MDKSCQVNQYLSDLWGGLPIDRSCQVLQQQSSSSLYRHLQNIFLQRGEKEVDKRKTWGSLICTNLAEKNLL